MAKIGRNAKAIAHAKYSLWVKKKNSLKHAKNVSTNTLELFFAKNGLKKQLKNGHIAKAIAHVKYPLWFKN